MVTRSKQIYKRTADKHKLPLSLVETIGNAMFQELRCKLESAEALAYEMPKLGTFSLRFKRFLWRMQIADNRTERNLTLVRLIDQYHEDKRNAKSKRKAIKASKDNVEEHKEVSSGMDEIHTIQDSIETKDIQEIS